MANSRSMIFHESTEPLPALAASRGVLLWIAAVSGTAWLMAEGQAARPWRTVGAGESRVSSRFAASYQPLGDGAIRPTISGAAHVTLEGHLL